MGIPLQAQMPTFAPGNGAFADGASHASACFFDGSSISDACFHNNVVSCIPTSACAISKYLDAAILNNGSMSSMFSLAWACVAMAV